MATRSIIAVPHKGGWRGRYCHWDGYPNNQVSHLLGIILRDGVDKSRKTLIKHTWSCLETNQRRLDELWDGGIPDYLMVSGYGMAYANNQPRLVTDKSKNFFMAQFLYLLEDTHLAVYSADTKDRTKWVLIRHYPYIKVKKHKAHKVHA